MDNIRMWFCSLGYHRHSLIDGCRTWSSLPVRWYRQKKIVAKILSPEARALYLSSCSKCRPTRPRHKVESGTESWMLSGDFNLQSGEEQMKSCFCGIVTQLFSHIEASSEQSGARQDALSRPRCFVSIGALGEVNFCLLNLQAPGWRITFQIFASSLSPPARTITTHEVIPPLPTSKAMLRTVQNWISDCETRHAHKKFGSPSDARLPKRFIDVKSLNHDCVRLVTAKTSHQFTALSYCWGDGKQSKTTKENLISRSEHFRISELPQTHQDAIHFTRLLDVSYLWIDAICIIQDEDNHADFHEEASKMDYIYSSAYVVLAATQGSSSTDGFLHKRSGSLTLRSGITGVSGNAIELRAKRMNSHRVGFDRIQSDMDHLPLFKRAWCMQERLLANRILHFLQDEIIFACQTARKCECGIASYANRPSDAPSIWSMDWNKGSEGERWIRTWIQIVNDFLELTITKPEDVLPALSGIARRMKQIYPGSGRYIAGMWEFGLAFQLEWSDVDYLWSKYSERKHCLEVKSREIFYPSFSWISRFATRHKYKDVEFTTSLPGYRQGKQQLCWLAETQPRSQAQRPFEKFDQGSIALRGPCITGMKLREMIKKSISDSVKTPSYSGPLVRMDFDGPGSIGFGDLAIEDSHCEMGRPSTICLGLTWVKISDMKRKKETGEVTALLLGRTPDGLAYVRLGLVNYLSKRFFDEYATEMEIVVR